MIKFYYNTAPNPAKIALLLEETGLAYEIIPVDTRKGEQFHPDFLAINPNAKLPAIVDGDAVVFDSTAILLYLGRKTGQFMPADTPALQGEFLSWMMFVASGIGPYSGQAVHFRHFAPEPKDYAVNRYVFEAKRHWGVLDAHLAKTGYMVGGSYSVADMSVWGWARVLPFVLGDSVWTDYPHVKKLFDEINERPAAKRVEALKGKYSFKTEMDEEARSFMFQHIKHSAA